MTDNHKKITIPIINNYNLENDLSTLRLKFNKEDLEFDIEG